MKRGLLTNIVSGFQAQLFWIVVYMPVCLICIAHLTELEVILAEKVNG